MKLPNKQSCSSERRAESGNAFFIVIISVVLFAALMFTFSRGGRQGGDNISAQRADILASDILTYAQKVERGVGRLVSRSLSESEISFDNSFVSGYDNADCTVDRCKLFKPDGGGITWMAPPEGANDGSAWIFTGANYVKGLGDGGGDFADSDLLVVLPNVNALVCTTINEKLGIENPGGAPPQENDTADDTSLSLYTGSFSATPALIEEDSGGTRLDERRTGCFQGDTNPASGTYHFYHVLLQRP